MKNYSRIINQKTFEKKVQELRAIKNTWYSGDENSDHVKFTTPCRTITFKKVYINTIKYYVMVIL